MVFKNPLGIAGSSNAQSTNAQLPPAATNLPLPSGYDAPAFSQQRPAGSHHPVLAPRPVALHTLEQTNLSAALASEQGGFQVTDNPPLYHDLVHSHGPSVPDRSSTQRAPISSTGYHDPSQGSPANFDRAYQQRLTWANKPDHFARHNPSGSQSTGGWLASYGIMNQYIEHQSTSAGASNVSTLLQV